MFFGCKNTAKKAEKQYEYLHVYADFLGLLLSLQENTIIICDI